MYWGSKGGLQTHFVKILLLTSKILLLQKKYCFSKRTSYSHTRASAVAPLLLLPPSRFVLSPRDLLALFPPPWFISARKLEPKKLRRRREAAASKCDAGKNAGKAVKYFVVFNGGATPKAS